MLTTDAYRLQIRFYFIYLFFANNLSGYTAVWNLSQIKNKIASTNRAQSVEVNIMAFHHIKFSIKRNNFFLNSD